MRLSELDGVEEESSGRQDRFYSQGQIVFTRDIFVQYLYAMFNNTGSPNAFHDEVERFGCGYWVRLSGPAGGKRGHVRSRVIPLAIAARRI